MDDLIEALKARLTSPIFGYFGLALIAFNWEAFFYLFAHSGDVAERIKYVHDSTDTLTLLILPLAFSLAISTSLPWLALLVAWLTAKPVELKDHVQANTEHRLLIRRKKLEEVRSSLLAREESELIERAKRDQELGQLENEEIRRELKAEIEKLRAERDSAGTKTDITSPAQRHKELMEIAGSYRDRAEQSRNPEDRHGLLEQAQDLENKAHQLIANSVSSEIANS